jgi:hypothetical protein
MLLDELLTLIPEDTKDRVDNGRDRANQIIREALRNETGLRLKRPVTEEVVNVRVRLVEGMPVSLGQRQIEEKHRVAALIAPWRHTLETLQRGGVETLKLYATLASDRSASDLVKESVAPLEFVLASVSELLQQTHGFSLTQWILDVNNDVLGIYSYRLPKFYQPTFERPDRGESAILTSICIGGLSASSRDRSMWRSKTLRLSLLPHELAHAFTHAGFDIDGETWNCSDFGSGTIEVTEGLAQYYAWRVCDR